MDRRVLASILEAAEISPGDMVVEVGPGRGILTRELAKSGASVIAVEIDEAIVANLTTQFKDNTGVRLVAADARQIDLESLVPAAAPYKVVANLPYYAAAPIVRRFLQATHKPRLMVVMVQREVAQNMAAAPGKMGLMSVAIQLYGEPRIVSYVPPRAFRPAPKVTSAIIRIQVRPSPAVAFDSEERFFTLVRAGFSSPRKQVRNSLRHGLAISAESAGAMLSEAGVDSSRRPQTLTLDEWGKLYDAFRRVSGPSPDAERGKA